MIRANIFGYIFILWIHRPSSKRWSRFLLKFSKKFYYCLNFMIRFPALLFFSFLLYQQNGYCQNLSTPVIIKHLLSQKKEIPLISGSFVTGELFRILPQNEMPRQLWQENQYLIYTPGNLYLGINGTGRLYKMSDQDNTLHFIREDSTFYLGNNFCAANLFLNNSTQ